METVRVGEGVDGAALRPDTAWDTLTISGAVSRESITEFGRGK